MEFIRSRIETQLMSLTGLSLGQLDRWAMRNGSVQRAHRRMGLM